MPEVVTDAPISSNFPGTDYKTIYYDKLAPLFIEAIKEQQKQIEQQQKQIEELKAVINSKLIN